MAVLPPTPGSVLMTMRYAANGLDWCALIDNLTLGWVVADTGQPKPPVPVVIGLLPPAAPKTDPVASPQWAVRQGLLYFLQDNIARGGSAELFSFISTNNGAQRKLYADFADTALRQEFIAWGQANPTLYLTAPP
jgi:hypothetical protein